ncbi:MAG: hypothetical protein NUV97_03415 [archaeon]|nr:hypothetical protein [archaeon]MCR4323571.1 hypothetical protein [Nanoarchaeota archaeon]
MKILNYKDIGNAWINYYHPAGEVVNSFSAENQRFSLSAAGITQISLAHLMAAFETPNLKGKTILDLGSGSSNSRGNTNGIYEPWLCRVLDYMGAVPIGLDVGSSDENFRFIQARLFEQDKLVIDPSGKIIVDAAHSRGLVDCPEVMYKVVGSESDLVRRLSQNLEGIVKPDGFFLWANSGDIGKRLV